MRYFFNYRDPGRYFPDGEGTDLSDLDAARAEGRQSARELLGTERAESYVEFSGGAYEISDESRSVLALVRFDKVG